MHRPETRWSHPVGADVNFDVHDLGMDVIPFRPDLRIVAAEHPSLDHDVERFLDELRSETRRFGPSARTNPKPFGSLVSALGARSGLRLGVVECGRIIALVRVDDSGVVWLAVHGDHRGHGLGTELARVAVEHAIALGHPRLVLRTTRRSRAALRVSEKLGCRVVELDRGRTELMFESGQRRSA